MESHQSCDDSNPCLRLDPPVFPENDPAFCTLNAALGAEADQLAALVATWNAQDCGGDNSCNTTPGDAVCVAGQCEREDPIALCDQCDDTLDPVCTVTNENAVNSCWAENCLQAEVAYVGYCNDSPACDAVGGDCAATFYDDPFCPAGSAYDPDAMEKGCAQGNFLGTCCTPWDEPCPFIDYSYNLSLDPFTCAEPNFPGSPFGSGSMCLYTNGQTSCTVDAGLVYGLEPPLDVAITIEIGADGTVAVHGVDNTTLRTFDCAGVMGYGPDDASGAVWTCTACDAGDCTSCDLIEHRWCEL